MQLKEALSEEKKRGAWFGLLPERVRAELSVLAASRHSALSSLGELRLRAGGTSSARFGKERIGLSLHLTYPELEECLRALTGGALYAFRDTIAEGYIPLGEGVRVGVAGLARYEGGTLVGVSRVRSLVFRIPTVASPFTAELFRAFNKMKCGMLIYSPPAGGKTTAIRSLARRLGSGGAALNVAVLDERREFSEDDFSGTSVDILSGYKKAEAAQIALRTLAPDVIIADEIGGEREALAMLSSLNSGVPVIATAHAASLEELHLKRSLEPFFSHRIFDCFAELSGDKCLIRYE